MKIEIEFCEMFQNDISLEEEPLPETSQGNESLQTQQSTIPKSDKENVNKRFHVLHVQRLFRKPYGKNAFCWAFYVINDNTQVPQSDALHVMSQKICPFYWKNRVLKNKIIF